MIVIDEAHNLMDAIMAINSTSISLAKLDLGRTQLMMYLQKFRARLKGKNRVYVTQIVRILDSLIGYLRGRLVQSTAAEGSVLPSELMSSKGADQINVFKLAKYMQESRLARKIDGYVAFVEQDADPGSREQVQKPVQRAASGASRPLLMHIQEFLMALMNPADEGRFFYSRSEDGKDVALRYILLDPTFQFREIVEEARAVILAGGTMSPMSDYVKHLFSYVPKEGIVTLSCDHVVPASNLMAWSVERDAQGKEFDFTFQNRQSKGMIESAGQTLLDLVRVIPDGVVVFFASYAYLDTCIQEWKSSSTWANLALVKHIFLEPRSNKTSSTGTHAPTMAGPAATESLLSAYSKAILEPSSGKGAVLLSVINGSMSEGINFSDALGRAVIVFGLPFPNPHSAEWKAKMEYIRRHEATPALGKAAAQEFYENAAMRAVNQAVGRAIRHKNDFASIFLVDKRYGGERIRGKLPGWIRGSLQSSGTCVQMLRQTRAFFDSRGGE